MKFSKNLINANNINPIPDRYKSSDSKTNGILEFKSQDKNFAKIITPRNNINPKIPHLIGFRKNEFKLVVKISFNLIFCRFITAIIKIGAVVLATAPCPHYFVFRLFPKILFAYKLFLILDNSFGQDMFLNFIIFLFSGRIKIIVNEFGKNF